MKMPVNRRGGYEGGKDGSWGYGGEIDWELWNGCDGGGGGHRGEVGMQRRAGAIQLWQGRHSCLCILWYSRVPYHLLPLVTDLITT